jgi:hypothetical protein
MDSTPLSAHLHVSKFTGDAGRHVCPADPDPRRKPFALIPPLAPMCLAKKTQVFPICKNTHGDPQTLQNKHWHTSAKRPILTVQARSHVCSSLAKPLTAACRAVFMAPTPLRDTSSCAANANPRLATILWSNNHAFFNDAPFGLRRRGAPRALPGSRLVARGLPGHRHIEPIGGIGTCIRKRIAGMSGRR